MRLIDGRCPDGGCMWVEGDANTAYQYGPGGLALCMAVSSSRALETRFKRHGVQTYPCFDEQASADINVLTAQPPIDIRSMVCFARCPRHALSRVGCCFACPFPVPSRHQIEFCSVLAVALALI